ncbi:MAG: hypothetical protein ABSH11_14130 [Verrucomicrobiota bacterium]|jgi:hypothetical protein
MNTTRIKAIGWLLILLGALVVIFSGKIKIFFPGLAPNTGAVVRWITLVAAVGVLICLSGILVLFRTVKAIRWIARIFSVLIILFWGIFIVGSFVSSIRGGHSSGPLSMHDRMGLTLMFAWLLGLALAWKWELAGAALTLAAILIEAFFINWKVVAGLGMLPPITALLFLLCWWMGRQSRQVKHDNDA